MESTTNELMTGVSGVRGIVGRGLTVEVAAAYAGLLGSGPILLARDSRASGPALREAVSAALTTLGRDVVDLGVVPTPTLLLNTALMGAAGGIIITASHNPIEWNGLKFADPRGRYLSSAHSSELFQAVRESTYSTRASGHRGGLKRDDEKAVCNHFARVRSARGVDIDRMRAGALHVVVDGCGGAGSAVLPRLLEESGVTVTRIHCTPDGTFPRPPEPLTENLTDLQAAVIEAGASLGLALDPDADRLALVGPGGTPMGEEVTLPLCARQVLAGLKRPVAANLSTSRMLDDVAAEAGVPVVRTPVGEINVVEGMERAGAVVGGEGNGGVIHGDVVLGRDALTASALILTALADAGGDAQAMRSAVPSYAMLKRRYGLPRGGVGSFREQLVARAGETGAESTDLRDGLRADWADRWVHVRPSNTEPIVRLICEAPDEASAVELAVSVAALLQLEPEG